MVMTDCPQDILILWTGKTSQKVHASFRMCHPRRICAKYELPYIMQQSRSFDAFADFIHIPITPLKNNNFLDMLIPKAPGFHRSMIREQVYPQGICLRVDNGTRFLHKFLVLLLREIRLKS